MDDVERKAAVEIGYRIPAGPLIEHALAIKGIAQADLPAFKAEGLLQEENLDKLDGGIGEVHDLMEDQTNANHEARMQTAGQATALREVKIARRKLGHLVERAYAGKPELAQYRQSSTRSNGIAATCTDVNEKLAFAKERQTQLAPFGVSPAFLAQLEANVRALEQASGSQNAAIAQLPDSMRAFCEAKGRLYLVVKDIISAGHALHAGNLEAAAKYNAKRLYPKSGKGKAGGTGETGSPEKK